MFAQVVVDVKNSNVNRLFDYKVNENLEEVIKVGSRVIVDFNGRFLLGFVLKLSSTSLFANKEITELIDIYPVLTKENLDMIFYFYKIKNVLIINFIKTILPNIFLLKVKKKYKVINKDLIDKKLLSFCKNDIITIDQKIIKELKKEIDEKNVIEIYSYKLERKKTLSKIKLNDLEINELKNINNKQKEIVEYLRKRKDVYKSELKNFSLSSLKTLLNKKILIEYQEETFRKIKINYKEENKNITLTEEQLNVINKIDLNSKKEYLLFGVTNSGKTEVYLNLIKKVLKLNKTAILLVPEINLTPLIISRVKNRFDKVAVFHSGLSDNERFDEYRRVLNKDAKIVVGTRSAIFMPLTDLGIIILDEEQDDSYMQTENLNYDTKEIARLRSNYHNCPVVYGTATPKITSFYKACNKEYELLTLENKINALPINAKLIDMKEEFKNGNLSIFSYELKAKIKDRLEKKEQVLILMNRKGHNQFVMCRECGYVLKCDNCDIAYTYYKSDDTLRCHYCGKKISNVRKCPKCNSKYIKYVGIGTEKVYEEIIKNFNCSCARMDQTTVTSKDAYDKILTDFLNHKYDILLGTQMISKGHDFPNVTLVGILMADSGLNISKYSAREKTFDLVCQTIGRSGRANKCGEVLIQAYDTNSFVLDKAKNQNYIDFYKQELENRRISNYPPFCFYYEILFSGLDLNYLINKALEYKKLVLDFNNDALILGPSDYVISKIKNKHIVYLRVKSNIEIEGNLYKSITLLKKRDIIINVLKK